MFMNYPHEALRLKLAPLLPADSFYYYTCDRIPPPSYHRNIATIWKDNLRVVLVSTRNPLNIGAAARAMANFGFSRLRVVNPYDVAFREARSAVGAAPLLQTAEEYSSVGEAVADCELVVGTTCVVHRELQHPLRRVEYGAGLIIGRLKKAPVG